MPDVTVDVEVYCAACGAGLCGQTESTTGHFRGEPQFRVQPCEQCLNDARQAGRDEGYEEAAEAAEVSDVPRC